jgi:hypothetical protein
MNSDNRNEEGSNPTLLSGDFPDDKNKMIMHVDRSANTQIKLSKDGAKLIKKDIFEVASVYRSLDETEATR